MENIKRLRGINGLTQKEFAEKIGVSRTAANDMEKSTRHNLKPGIANKICGFFGISLCELYGIDNIKYPPKTKEEAEKLCDLIMRKFE